MKPGNIFFDADWTIKVGDFGLIKNTRFDARLNPLAGTKNSKLVLPQMTKGVGTEMYMSPEQKEGQTYDRKVDIYALAIIFFELLAGPFDTSHERIVAINNLKSFKFPPEFGSNHGKKMVRIFQKCNVL